MVLASLTPQSEVEGEPPGEPWGLRLGWSLALQQNPRS